MPDNATDIAVLRVVVRDFSADLAQALRDDIVTALGQLDALKPEASSTSCSPSLTKRPANVSLLPKKRQTSSTSSRWAGQNAGLGQSAVVT